jgi:hypothetical protein
MAIKRIHITGSGLALEEVEVSRQLLFSVLDRVELVDSRPEVGGVSSEGDLKQVKETVDTSEEGLRAALDSAGRVRPRQTSSLPPRLTCVLWPSLPGHRQTQ